MPHGHGRLLLLRATCAQASIPSLGTTGLGQALVNDSSCAPADLEMHQQSCIRSKLHASGVLTQLFAHKASDPVRPMPQRQDASRCNHAMGPWELQALPPTYSLPMGIWQSVHIIAVPLCTRRPAQIGRQIMAADMPGTGT
jgi:hypothetical protein